MAALPIPAPGTEHGPCANENCGHVGCIANRTIAACVCRICGDPIGYDRNLYDEWYDQPAGAARYAFCVHQICFVKEIEASRRTAEVK